MPEIEQLEPVVLAGETPDPTRIPAGCRFHPRCPALADGEAAAAGVDERCTGTSCRVLPAEPAPRRLPPRSWPATSVAGSQLASLWLATQEDRSRMLTDS